MLVGSSALEGRGFGGGEGFRGEPVRIWRAVVSSVVPSASTGGGPGPAVCHAERARPSGGPAVAVALGSAPGPSMVGPATTPVGRGENPRRLLRMPIRRVSGCLTAARGRGQARPAILARGGPTPARRARSWPDRYRAVPTMVRVRVARADPASATPRPEASRFVSPELPRRRRITSFGQGAGSAPTARWVQGVEPPVDGFHPARARPRHTVIGRAIGLVPGRRPD